MATSGNTGAALSTITIRGCPPEIKRQLRMRAASNARSMEAEALALIEAGLAEPAPDTTDFMTFARSLFAPIGGLDLSMPQPPATPPPVLPAAPASVEARRRRPKANN